MTSRETPTPGPLRLPRLDRIRTKLLVFAVVIAILPALATGWVFYTSSKRAVRDRIGADLESAALRAAQETDLWLKQRLSDLGVYARSPIVTSNLDRGRRAGSRPVRSELSNYLDRVRGRFPDYLEFQALTLEGRVVGSSPAGAAPLSLATEHSDALGAGQAAFGEVVVDSTSGSSIAVAIPVQTDVGRVIGSLVVRFQLDSLGATLHNRPPVSGRRLMLADRHGTAIPFQGLVGRGVDSLTLASLLKGGTVAQEFEDRRGESRLGAAAEVTTTRWVALVEVPQTLAYRELIRLRNLSLLAIVALALLLGGAGYVIGLYVVRPIDGLTRAATGVASGDLDVELPVVGKDEVASLTEVFNDMVRRLREDRDQIATMERQLKRRNQELEELSITDGLTGLRNRRHIMATLDHEFVRASRTGRPVAVLMLDVDHFKQLNDRLGHLAGDEILVKIASAIRSAVRGVDYAARYGGEEFVVVLPETDQTAAQDVGERIREYVAGAISAGDGAMPITLSIGVAGYPVNGASTAEVLARADAALYRAKERGRNRVELADGNADPPG